MNTDIEYKVTETGEIDVNYYINKGRALRSEAIRTYSFHTSEKLKALGNAIIGLFYQPKAA